MKKGGININLLLCGNGSAFQKKLINKLIKENHDIYVISGTKNVAEGKTKSVMQRFDFEFTNDRVVNVIDNIKPDMVIFIGEYIENEGNTIESKESSQYLSGLTNVITASKFVGVKKFVFISRNDADENNTLRCGEKLCEVYRDGDIFEVDIIRMPEMYGSFGDISEEGGIVDRLTIEALQKKEIIINPKQEHYLIEINDAVEACFQIGFKIKDEEEKPFDVPGKYYSEEEIAKIIQDSFAEEIKIREEEQPIEGKKKYDVSRVESFGFVHRNNLIDTIGQIQKNLLEKVSEEKKVKKERSETSRIVFAFIENVVLFFVAYILTKVFSDTWIGDIVNFYMIYVVIIAVVHGVAQTLISTLLSIIGEFYNIMSEEGIGAIFSDYSPYVWVLQLLIIGVLVSYMKDKFKMRLRDLKDNNEFLEAELEEIKEINDSNVYIKSLYEKRIINYKNSMSRIYDVTSALDYLEPQKVIFQATEVIARLMESKNVAVYIGSEKSKYYRLAAATSEISQQLGKSFAVEEGTEIYNTLMEKEIFRNKNLAENLPVMAGAIYNQEKIVAIIMIWPDSVEGTTIYQANLMAMLCRLVEKSILRAYDFMEALQDKSFYGNTNVMKEEAFINRFLIYEEGKKSADRRRYGRTDNSKRVY